MLGQAAPTCWRAPTSSFRSRCTVPRARARLQQARELARHLGLPRRSRCCARTRRTRRRPTCRRPGVTRTSAARLRSSAGAKRSRADRRAGRRCEHDGRDAEACARALLAAARRRCGRLRLREPCLDGREHVAGDGVLGALAVQAEPAVLPRLAAVAVAHARQQREVALVAIAIGGLAPGRGLRRDVEQDRQVGRRQDSLASAQPRGIEPLRLAVGDARREVAVADRRRPLGQPALDLRPASRSGSRRTAAA